jgi:crotonobetainyl-CoA:carnitine CoA-transferase CaiB-like acyl-CoA transferase
MSASEPKHVLDGYKILDFTQFLAGPTVTRLMAEMGADIIKVERAPKGDLSRMLPFLKDGRSAYYIQQNRGKKSLCIDPKNPAGLEILKELIPKMDVLVENYGPGVIGRIGLDYKTVSAINPRIVMCSISALGQEGPLALKPGYDYIGASYAAVIDMIGDPNGPPSFPALGIGDVSAGVHALAAITSALLYRERTGKGQFVEATLLDSYFHCHEVNVQVLSASRGAIKPRRAGSHHYLVCPFGIFKGKQSYIFICVLDQQWPSLCRAMGRPELIDDPRFSVNAKRAENSAATIKIVQDWIDSTKDDEAALHLMGEHRVPAAPVLSVEQAVNHPHLRGRRTVRTVTDRIMHDFDIPGVPLKFSRFPEELPLQAPFLGEHNAEILTNYLGYSAERVDQLKTAGVLHQRDN